MKSYEQMARSVLSRRDQILKREQQKKVRFFRYAARVSTACGALALSIGAVAVWHNIKDTQKDLDEIVRPTEATTQTTVSQPDGDNGNNNSNYDNVIQDTAETTTPAVTTKMVVTSVSKNKEGKKVIVTTEVAVPITPSAQTTVRPIIGPSPVPAAKVTTKPFIGPSPVPGTKKTTKLPAGPISRPTAKSSTDHNAWPIPVPTTVTTTVKEQHTEAPQPTVPPSTTTWAAPVTSHTTYATWAPQQTAAPVQTTMCEQTTNVYTQEYTPSPEPTQYIDYNPYRTFELNGRYFNFMNDTYYGETEGMTMYYTGPVTFYDWQNQPVYDNVSIYAKSGEYKVIVHLHSQGRYIWYNISYPF